MEKIKYVVLIFFLPIICLGQNLNWQNLNLPYSQGINKIVSTDSGRIYIAQKRKLFTSTDDGSSWNFVDSVGSSNSINYYSNFMPLQIVSDSLVLKGYDSLPKIFKLKLGDSLLIEDSTLREVAKLTDIRYSNGCYFGIDTGSILIRYTGGVFDTIRTTQRYLRYSVNDSNIAVASRYKLYLSDNLGSSWDTLSYNYPFWNAPLGIHYNGSDTIYLRYPSYPWEERVTFDRGLSWLRLDSIYGLTRRPYSFVFSNWNNEVIGNFGEIFLYSTDGGFTFYDDTIPGRQLVRNHYYTHLTSWGTVFVYGDSGLISRTTNFRTITSLSEGQNDLSRKIEIYPNPLTETFSIKGISCKSIENLEIRDVRARVMREVKNACGIVNVGGLKSGIYYVVGSQKGKRFTKKIVIK